MEAKKESKPDVVDKIIAYESGEMDDEQTVEFFQELYDSGLWTGLQGHYHRVMASLIEGGYIKVKC